MLNEIPSSFFECYIAYQKIFVIFSTNARYTLYITRRTFLYPPKLEMILGIGTLHPLMSLLEVFRKKLKMLSMPFFHFLKSDCTLTYCDGKPGNTRNANKHLYTLKVLTKLDENKIFIYEIYIIKEHLAIAKSYTLFIIEASEI